MMFQERLKWYAVTSERKKMNIQDNELPMTNATIIVSLLFSRSRYYHIYLLVMCFTYVYYKLSPYVLYNCILNVLAPWMPLHFSLYPNRINVYPPF